MSVRHSKYLSPFIFISDILLLNASLIIAHFIVFNKLFSEGPSTIFFLIVNIIWTIVSQIIKSFNVKRPLVLNDNLNTFLIAIIYHLSFVLGIIYFLKIPDISRLEVALSFTIFIILIFIQRSILFFALDFFRKKGYNHRDVIYIGNKLMVSRLMKSFNKHPEYGFDLSDFISEEQVAILTPQELKDKILNKAPDEIFICYEQLSSDFVQQMVQLGYENQIKINVVPGLVLGSNNNYATLINYDNVPVLRMSLNPEISFKIKILKRSFDLLFSLCVMVVGFPIFIILYLLTKITSKGPVFYKQERIGRNNKPFTMYKFRSMYVDSESAGPQLAKDHDSRITRWGLIMRKTRLDELPQFWNVLKGEMSVVGPRPERQHFIEKILEKTPDYKKLSCLKPGLTSIGQVHYGYAQNVDEMCRRVRYDLIYLQNISFNSDIDIIFRTVKVMIKNKGK